MRPAAGDFPFCRRHARAAGGTFRLPRERESGIIRPCRDAKAARHQHRSRSGQATLPQRNGQTALRRRFQKVERACPSRAPRACLRLVSFPRRLAVPSAETTRRRAPFFPRRTEGKKNRGGRNDKRQEMEWLGIGGLLILCLIINSCVGPCGTDTGRSLAGWRVRHSSEWKEFKQKESSLEYELEETRKREERRIGEEQSGREREFREWEELQRTWCAQRQEIIESQIDKLDGELQILPVEDSDFYPPLFLEEFERWAQNKRPDVWRQWLDKNDSAAKLKESLDDMRTRAETRGGRVENDPAFSEVNSNYAKASGEALRIRTDLVSEYVDTMQKEAIAHVKRQFGVANDAGQLNDRMRRLEERISAKYEAVSACLANRNR